MEREGIPLHMRCVKYEIQFCATNPMQEDENPVWGARPPLHERLHGLIHSIASDQISAK